MGLEATQQLLCSGAALTPCSFIPDAILHMFQIG